MQEHRILLVQPLGYKSQDAAKDIARVANLMPPLGLCSIAAYLEQHDIKADIIDCFAHPDSDSRIETYIRENNPRFIGVTCTTSCFNDAVRTIRLAKGIQPQIRAVAGGPHISALKEDILLDNPEIDFAVVGEGELPLRQLIQAENRHHTSIPGLVYRTAEGTVSFNPPARGQIALDELPFPAYEKLEGYPDAYRLPIFNYPRTPNASCVSSRGCPYTCSYCDRSVFGKSYRYNSAGYVYRHMKYLKDRWGIRHVNFYDDQFTFNHRRVAELCDLLIENRLDMTFNCAARAEHLNAKMLRKMRQAGCWMISLGIETGDTELLKRHRSHASLERMTEAIAMVSKAGIRVKGLLMLGLPGETEDTIKRSKEYVFSQPIDDFNLAKFTPFPGTPLYASIRDYGTFDEDPEKMDCMHFVFVTDGLTEEKLEEHFLQFYRAHFTRPKVLWGYFTMLWKSPDSWKRFLGNLTRFLKFASSNKRIHNRASHNDHN